MKTSNFNINRIGALLRYDWMLNKHKLSMAAVLATAIYACLVLLYFSSKSVFEFGVNEGFPYVIGAFIWSFFSYVQIAMVFVVTTMLHQKFTSPNSATSYLSLPGTSLEKTVVMLSEYLIGCIAVWALYVVCFYVTMLVCAIAAPQINWMINAFAFFSPGLGKLDEITTAFGGESISGAMNELQNMDMGYFATTITDIIKVSVWLAPFSAIAKVLIYANLNMCFRSNGQIKSIAIWMAASFAIFLLFIIGTFIVFGHDIMLLNDQTEVAVQAFVGDVAAVLQIVKYFVCLVPVVAVALAYLYYYQVCKKQAK